MSPVRGAESGYPIDFVITWVDGSDPAWLAEKARQAGEGAAAVECGARSTINEDRDIRFRDWDLLRYWFRGVESFAPWVRTVHFLTWGHVPAWLDTSHPKLHVVRHEDFIPHKYLPTFSSHTIEWNMHRVPGLAEHFVYFNDDMFILKETTPELFFKNGLPCGSAILNPERVSTASWFFVPVANVAVLNDHFSPRECVKKNPAKWLNLRYGFDVLRTVLMLPYPRFFGLLEDHLPHAFLKSSFTAVWEAESGLLDMTCSHRFRCNTDINQWLVEWWQYASGMFEPRSLGVGHYFGEADGVTDGVDEAAEYVASQRGYMACINDNTLIGDVDAAQAKLSNAFQKILPGCSSFELS